VGKEIFTKTEAVTYLISSSLGNRQAFLGSLISSQHLGSGDILSEDEDEPTSIHGIPL